MDLEKTIQELKENIQDLNNSIERLYPHLEELRAENKELKRRLHLQELGPDFKIGKDIVTHAHPTPDHKLLTLAKDLFGYVPAESLAQEMSPKILQAKRFLMINDQGASNDTSVQRFYIILLNLMLEERFPEAREKGKPYIVMDPQSPQSGDDLKGFFSHLIIGSQVFKSAEYENKTFSKCPPVILKVKQNRFETPKESSFESLSHEIATYMARCLKDYGHLNSPKYLVGIILDLDGADVFLIHLKSLEVNIISEETVKKISLTWNFSSLIESVRSNLKEDGKMIEILKVPQMNSRDKAGCCSYFYELFDFIFHLLK